MTRSNTISGVVLGLLVPFAGGCKTNATIDTNLTPVASAGESQVVPYNGSPVEVTLDGSGSSDADGQIVDYLWFSADGVELDGGGVGRAGPDPDNRVRPTVSLDQGMWLFTLWVRDNAGAVSDPDSVQITVGEPAACDPIGCEDENGPPALGTWCCTSSDTGEMPGDFRGRAPDECGLDIGGVLPDLAGICLQVGQMGTETPDCPEVMATAGPQVGCCTDEGLCGSTNTSIGLGCHYDRMVGPGAACTP